MNATLRLAALSAAFSFLTPQIAVCSSEPDVTAPSPFGANWGYLYGHTGVKPRPFLSAVRELGGGFSRVVLFWQQIEPQKGQFDWSALDTYVNDLEGPDEGFVTLYSEVDPERETGGTGWLVMDRTGKVNTWDGV